MKTRWRLAYCQARTFCWGTLWMSNSRILAETAIAARDFTRAEPMLPASRFHALGYYRRGWRRV